MQDLNDAADADPSVHPGPDSGSVSLESDSVSGGFSVSFSHFSSDFQIKQCLKILKPLFLMSG